MCNALRSSAHAVLLRPAVLGNRRLWRRLWARPVRSYGGAGATFRRCGGRSRGWLWIVWRSVTRSVDPDERKPRAGNWRFEVGETNLPVPGRLLLHWAQLHYIYGKSLHWQLSRLSWQIFARRFNYQPLTDQESKANLAKIVTRIASGELRFLDGIMSPVSVEISARLSAAKSDMNSWWVKTAQDWACPACGRAKLDIARLNSKGEAMCQLVEHHDHMRDVLKRRFGEISASREVVVADELAEKFAKRSATMVAAYDNTIICGDCNNADVVAKKSAATHRDFSFSPQELRRIVKPAANRPHEIDSSVAQAIWAEQRMTFDLRIKIIDRIAEISANNEHWFQPGSFVNDPEVVNRRVSSFVSEMRAFGIWETLAGSKSMTPKRPASRWREIEHKAPEFPPTKGDIQHAGQVGSRKFWLGTDESWCCPVCNRNRRQIVRQNKGGDWTMPYSSRNFFSLSARWKKQEVLTCGDCAEVAQSLGKEAAERVGLGRICSYSAMVSIDEVARCIIPQAHARHNIDVEQAEAVIDEVSERLIFSENLPQS